MYEQRKHAWKNTKHQAQWLKSLEIHAFPEMGEMRIDQAGTSDVLRVLSPIWTKTPETARRIKQRIGMIFDWAKAAGHREGDNPIDGLTNALVKQKSEGRHFAAMPYVEVPAFVQNMRTFNAALAAKLVFEFLILTAARTSEVLLAESTEVDLELSIWTVPAGRMKAGKVHRVPLSPRCVEIVTQVRSMFPHAAVLFPGRSDRQPLSNMAFLMILRRQEYEVTAHGFRSAFRDWAAEQTNFSREICEMALAHTIQNKVEAAYRRGDLLDKRRELMNEWASYVASTLGKTSG